MSFELPRLPYSEDALGEYMSAETLRYHHGKHHLAYVESSNRLVSEEGWEGRKLSDVIIAAWDSGKIELFNQSAQLWNHSFYWQCLAPPSGAKPMGRLAAMLEESFGSASGMIEQLVTEAVDHFSNGWAWLILDRDQLKVTSLHDADTPVAHEGMSPLLTLDVWEHAYYIDYRNDRGDFAEKVLGNIINWEFVAQNLDGGGVARADQG